jgi:dynamin 1/3
MVDKIEWVKKIRGVILSKGGSVKGPNISEGGTMRQNHSDGSLVSSTLVPYA